MTDDVEKRFGLAVATRREELKLTKTELGARIGIRSDMLGRMERGDRGWRLASASAVAKALGTSVDALLRQVEHPDPFGAMLSAVVRTSGERAAILLLLDRMEEK